MKNKKTKGAAVAVAVGLAIATLFGPNEAPQPSLRPFYGQVQETAETQTISFRFAGEDSLAYPATEVRRALKPHRSEGFVIKPKGRETWSKPQTLARVVPLLGTKTEGAALGAVWWVKALGDRYRVAIWRYDSNPLAFMDTAGTHPVDLVVGTVVQHFPRVTNLGIFACKRVSGSTSYSQHSWSNAVDFGGPGAWGSPSYVAYLDQVNAFVQDLWDAGLLPVAQLGWRNWPDHYPGHIHVSGAPMFTGVPGCAR